MEKNRKLRILQRARENAFDAYATWYLFNRRVSKYKLRIEIVSWFGLCLPASVGLMIALQGKPAFTYWLNITIFLGAIQFLINSWAIVARWTDNYSNADKCREQAAKLRSKWEKLIDIHCDDEEALEREYNTLFEYHEAAEAEEVAQNVKQKEIRRGHRAALIEFNQKCAKCGEKPDNMKSTKCSVCGNLYSR